MLLETISKFRASSEDGAKDMIEKYRLNAEQKGYRIKKAGYEYKSKKAKGEIIAECWIVTIDQIFGDMWEDLV